MKKLVFLIILCIYAPKIVKAGEIVPTDKIAHFGISFSLTAAGAQVCRIIIDDEKHKWSCILGTSLAVLGLGVTKEILDGKNNSKSEHMKDMGANILGIASGALVISIDF